MALNITNTCDSSDAECLKNAELFQKLFEAALPKSECKQRTAGNYTITECTAKSALKSRNDGVKVAFMECFLKPEDTCGPSMKNFFAKNVDRWKEAFCSYAVFNGVTSNGPNQSMKIICNIAPTR